MQYNAAPKFSTRFSSFYHNNSMNTSNYERGNNAADDCQETTAERPDAEDNGAQQGSGNEAQGAPAECGTIPTQGVVNSVVDRLSPLVNEETDRITKVLLREAAFALIACNREKPTYSVTEMKKALIIALQKLFGIKPGSCQ